MDLFNKASRFCRTGRAWWVALPMVLCAGLAQAQVQVQEVAASEPYPPQAYRCAVLAGGAGSRFSDARLDGFWRQVNREVSGLLAERLRADTYDIDEVFTELADEGKQPPKALMAVSRSRCAQLIQISHDVGEDKDGRYLAFDVTVMRFRTNKNVASAQPGTTVLPIEDYSKRYRYPRTDELFKSLRTGQVAESAYKDLLSSGVIERIKGAQPVTDAMLRSEYERTVTNASDTEYKARHILLPTREQAQAVITRIKGGEPFEALAKAMSVDTGSGQAGGDLGWAGTGVYVKEFEQAMLALAPKGLSDAPVQSAFGWHVIELLDTRPTPRPSFESMKPMLTARLRQRLRRARP